jgi:probable phosphoglycerate mutase
MELILIRHGLPLMLRNEDGTPADPPLAEHGHEQAEAMAHWLSGEEFDRLYSSPMRRAHQTAEPLAKSQGLTIETLPAIAEYDRDADHYIPMEDLKRDDYEGWLEFVKSGYPPGVDVEKFRSTVVDGIEKLIGENPGKRVLGVCHGGVINAWAAHVLGIEFRLFLDSAYTSVNRFLAASSGERAVLSLNEAGHLRGL